MSLEVTAGLAGISKGYLSLLENGRRPFERRSLIDALAEALGCSVIDLTGEPYLPVSRQDAAAMAAIPDIERGLHDVTFDDVPDVAARPVPELVAAVRAANEHRDQVRYGHAGREIGELLAELQVTVATGSAADRHEALGGLVELGIVTYEISKNLGHVVLAIEAAQRGYEAAELLGDPALLGFAGWYRALGLLRIGAHRRAGRALDRAAATTESLVGNTRAGTLGAEVHGLVRLTQAAQAARAGQADEAYSHLAEAGSIAARTGERNGMLMHFGPTNVALWSTGVGVELVEGAGAAERRVDPGVLGSRNRTAGMHFDLARAFSQEDGRRDADAVHHLDQADRIAPSRIRHDPTARSLLATLDARAHVRSWELKSLRNRWGVAAAQ
jgi:transcriptional regulator with XRE-family HTH domain